MKAVVIGGASSGAGKTTLALGLMRAYARRDLAVQGFKVGPDFIDPGHYRAASGRVGHNLDGWMLTPDENLAIFARQAGGADLAVVEGVMGLFDGFSPTGEEGSTAQMAKLLGAPVLLTVGAKAMARTFAAVVAGLAGFDPELTFAGVVGSQVGSSGHADILKQSLEYTLSIPFLGGLVRRPELALGERHLGLVTAEDGGLTPSALDALADAVEEAIDLDGLLAELPEVSLWAPPALPGPDGPPVRFGVARDAAFCFYYQENLDRLAAAGAELVFFSPLDGHGLPPGLDGLYLGGGYPELYAQRLAANQAMRREVAVFCASGRPVYAECGGMMYLGRELSGPDGAAWPMVGALEAGFRLLPRLKTLGYREVVFEQDTPLGPAGTTARGHEFHYSEPTGDPDAAQVYRAAGRLGPAPATVGWLDKGLLASYVHLHFGSNPGLAPALVKACRRAKGNSA